MDIVKHVKRLFISDNERTGTIKRNIWQSFLAKGVSILASLILVPISIGYISGELYGVWLTLTSIIAWFSFFDIGFGNGLRNKLAEAIALSDYERGKGYVSTTYFYLALIFFMLAIIMFFICPIIPWYRVLNVDESLNQQLILVTRIVITAFSLQMIMRVQSSILLAYQRNAISSFMDAFGQVVTLIAICLIIKFTSPSLVYMSVAIGCSPLLVMFFFSVYMFLGKYADIRPSLKYVKRNYVHDIFHIGINFFIIQIACIVLYQMTNILISHTAGNESVTEYNVAYKYMNVAMMCFNIIIAPVWSSFTDAYVRQDYDWMNTIYNRLKMICFYTFFLLVLMLLVSPFVYRVWLGDKVQINFYITLGLSVYMMISVWNGLHSSIINGIGKIRLQLYCSLVGTFLFIPLSLLLGKYFGILGIITSMVILNILPVVLLKIQVNKLLSKTALGIWNK